MIGTYVGLRGGDELATLVRKTEPKPLRIFLQDGDQDLNIYGGDWWMENQTMNRALQWAGYEVEHVWGKDAHNHNHGAAIFPQAMRWLWKDYPQPVADPSRPLVEPSPRDAGGWCQLGTGRRRLSVGRRVGGDRGRHALLQRRSGFQDLSRAPGRQTGSVCRGLGQRQRTGPGSGRPIVRCQQRRQEDPRLGSEDAASRR